MVTVACIHHYVLGMPNGPKSLGRCRKCGNLREYDTVIPEEQELSFNAHPPVFQSKEQWVDSQERMHIAEALVSGDMYHAMRNVLMVEQGVVTEGVEYDA